MNDQLSKSTLMNRRSSLTYRILRHIFIVAALISLAYAFVNYDHTTDFALSTTAPPYNTFIDQDGYFILSPSYKILQVVTHPLPDSLRNLYHYLLLNSDLRDHFVLVSPLTYHVTLAHLKNDSSSKESGWNELVNEQGFLDNAATETVCAGKGMLLIEKQEIRLQIEYTEEYMNNSIKPCQKRWNERFPDLIKENATSFYITIAYQFKGIPYQNVLDAINLHLNSWNEFPITNIQLAPIGVFSFRDPITFEAMFL